MSKFFIDDEAEKIYSGKNVIDSKTGYIDQGKTSRVHFNHDGKITFIDNNENGVNCDLMHALFNKCVVKATYITRVVYIPIYTEFQRIAVYYGKNGHDIYTIKR